MLSTRRSFLGKLSAFVGAVMVPVVWSRGPNDVHSDGRDLHVKWWEGDGLNVHRVYCNGQDITMMVTECHRSQGWAKCYRGTYDELGQYCITEFNGAGKTFLMCGDIRVTWLN